MGNLNCCSQSAQAVPKTKIVSSNFKNSSLKPQMVLPDASSTSDCESQKIIEQTVAKPPKIELFLSFTSQRSCEISSIQKVSEFSQCFSEHQTFIKHFQKIQKQLSPTQEDKYSKTIETAINIGKQSKIDMKKFIQHSSKCSICYQLFQNFKNMEVQQTIKAPIQGEETRISLRDSLLEFQQCEKAKRCAECKFQILNSHEEAEKAMIKYPNTNKYQSKKLRFRKTSLFQPEIKEERQSQQSY